MGVTVTDKELDLHYRGVEQNGKIDGNGEILDLSIPLMRHFLRHNLVNKYRVVNYKIKNRELRRYMHPPSRLPGVQFFNVSQGLRVLG